MSSSQPVNVLLYIYIQDFPWLLTDSVEDHLVNDNLTFADIESSDVKFSYWSDCDSSRQKDRRKKAAELRRCTRMHFDRHEEKVSLSN